MIQPELNVAKENAGTAFQRIDTPAAIEIMLHVKSAALQIPTSLLPGQRTSVSHGWIIPCLEQVLA